MKIQPPVCFHGLYMDVFAFAFYILRCFSNAISAADTALPRILMASDDDDDDDDERCVLKIWKVAYSKALSSGHAEHNSN
jgi:hypothetical protein